MKKQIAKNIRLYYSEERYTPLAEDILADKLDIIKVLKDDNRSRVLLVNYQGEKLVVKESREKNTRKWQKFLSIFRGSYSHLEFKNCQKIIDAGFKGAKGLLVVDVTKGFWIDKSYFVSTFIEGREGSISDLDIITKKLKRVHEDGYLHRDAQLVNFMVGDNDEVYLIDCKLSKNKYGLFGTRYEFIFLERSCPCEIDVYPKDDIYYRVAKLLDDYREWLRRTKKKIRGRK